MKDMIKQLIANRAERWDQANAILASAVGGQIPAADAARYESLAADVTALDERIKELHGIAQANKKADSYQADYERIIAPDRNGGRVSAAEFKGQGHKRPYIRAETRKMSDESVFWRDWLSGREPQNHIDLDFSGQSMRRDTATGTFRPQAADLTTGDVAIATDVVPRLYQHLVENNAVMSVADVDNYRHGRSVVYPKSTVRGTAVITGEGTAIAEGEGAFGSLQLDAWKYASLYQLTNELIEDVEFDLMGYIARDAGRAIGKASGAHFATGDGSNKPRGLITAIANELGTAVQVGSATVEADSLIDLYYSVSAPYRTNAFWIFNDSTAKAIRKIRNANDEFLWTDGLNGAPAAILGRPVLIDPSVASIGSANLSVAFFNPDAYKIRTTPMRFERSDGFAFSSDLVTFRSVARMDGDLLDAAATSGAVLDTD